MNAKERKWIKENLTQIFITDIEEDNDQQTEHTLEFLWELAGYVGFDLENHTLK